MRSYSDSERADALKVCEQVGLYSAVKQTGIPRATLFSWMQKAGVKTSNSEKTQAATEAHLANIEERRARIRAKLLQRAEQLLDRVTGSYTTHVGREATPVQTDVPPAAACKDLAVAVGILIDKFRLECGEVTGREEVRHDYSERTDSDLIAEAERILAEATART